MFFVSCYLSRYVDQCSRCLINFLILSNLLVKLSMMRTSVTADRIDR